MGGCGGSPDPAPESNPRRTVRLCGGGSLRVERPTPVVDGRTAAPVLNVCRGWAADGTASRLAASGQRGITSTPPAPAFAELLGSEGGDPAAGFPEPPLRARSMRRRRVLDLVRAGPGLEVY